MIDPNSPYEMVAARALASRMSERACHGGTIAGEHDVGIGKLNYMQAEHGDARAVMGAIKSALNPNVIMNPGKLVPPTN